MFHYIFCNNLDIVFIAAPTVGAHRQELHDAAAARANRITQHFNVWTLLTLLVHTDICRQSSKIVLEICPSSQEIQVPKSLLHDILKSHRKIINSNGIKLQKKIVQQV